MEVYPEKYDNINHTEIGCVHVLKRKGKRGSQICLHIYWKTFLRVLHWPVPALWPVHICFPTSQMSLLCWEVSEHTQHACEMVADTLGAYVLFLYVL